MAHSKKSKMGLNATFCMAVGGMVGGGIFSVLGVVVQLAGPLAWLSFVLAGLIALATAFSYAHLTTLFEKDGGSFGFLRALGLSSWGASLSWILILGYVLTLAVYAFTFGHYTAEVFGLNGLWARVFAVGIVVALAALNLRGVGSSASFEIYAVWGKLAVLIGLAVIGIFRWQPAQLSTGTQGGGWGGALLGAASIFMAYEGFQLLAYDFDDIKNPDKTLKLALPIAVVAVIGVYVVVALGSAMLVGAGTLVEKKEIALALAGQAAMGKFGKILVSVAAAFSTGSAINATLFATARLSKTVARAGYLPRTFDQTNATGVPGAAILVLGAASATLAALGSLEGLVEAASLVFLATFALVGFIAWQKLKSQPFRAIGAAGALSASAASLALMGRLLITRPLALLAFLVVVALSLWLRPMLPKTA